MKTCSTLEGKSSQGIESLVAKMGQFLLFVGNLALAIIRVLYGEASKPAFRHISINCDAISLFN
jgi:hypothetical protein